jgi:N-acetyl-anhydromuramyl-L-alanine amidase AmpD
MDIIETNLQFNGLRSRTSTSLIVLHHSASADVPAEEIHAWHLARGWAGIGYHFVIRHNGTIERGRPLESIGAHAGPGVNGHSIGICLAGDFNKAEPSTSQINSLIELITYLNTYYASTAPEGLDIKLHREMAATECPGVLFPEEKIKQLLTSNSADNKGGNTLEDWKLKIMDDAKAAGLIQEEHQADDPAPKWFVLTVALRMLENMKNGGKNLER